MLHHVVITWLSIADTRIADDETLPSQSRPIRLLAILAIPEWANKNYYIMLLWYYYDVTFTKLILSLIIIEPQLAERPTESTDMSGVTCALNVGSNSKWRQWREWWVHQVPDSNVIKSVRRRLFHCLLHARIALDVVRPLINSWRAWVRLSCGATGT